MKLFLAALFLSFVIIVIGLVVGTPSHGAGPPQYGVLGIGIALLYITLFIGFWGGLWALFIRFTARQWRKGSRL